MRISDKDKRIMIDKKIKDWLNKKYDYGYDERIFEIMSEQAMYEDVEDLNLQDLYDGAIEEMEDDGGMFPNGRDYDSEDY